jgi:hypothetical protein
MGIIHKDHGAYSVPGVKQRNETVGAFNSEEKVLLISKVSLNLGCLNVPLFKNEYGVPKFHFVVLSALAGSPGLPATSKTTGTS